MLPLSRQNTYRERYRRLRPGWQSSGGQLETLLRLQLTPHTRLLDLGCGRGGVIELFWQSLPRAVGIDPDWQSLLERRAAFTAVCGAGHQIPLAAQSFEVVTAIWVLEHLPQPARVFQEVRRLLTPGGHFIFLTPNLHHPLLLANHLSWAFPAVQRMLIPRLYGRAEADTFHVHYRANTPEQLQALANAYGFQVNTLRVIKDPSYLAFNDLAFHMSVWLEDCLPANWGVHLLGDWIAV